MELTSRLNITAGVAVAGAGLIAITPAATQPMLDLQGPREALVQLTTSAVDDIPGLAGDLPGAADGDSPTTTIGWVEFVLNTAQTQLSDAGTYFGAGDMANGLWSSVTGLSNILIAAPQTALLGTIDSLLGQGIYAVEFDRPIDAWPSDDWAGLASDIQTRIDDATSSFNVGFSDIADGEVGMGLALLVHGLNHLTVEIPMDLLVGPLAITLADL